MDLSNMIKFTSKFWTRGTSGRFLAVFGLRGPLQGASGVPKTDAGRKTGPGEVVRASGVHAPNKLEQLDVWAGRTGLSGTWFSDVYWGTLPPPAPLH
eukprot:9475501-Pyramimonas_sp.AAC.1